MSNGTIGLMTERKYRLPHLVRRIRAPRLVLYVLIAFGATVLAVRIFLELTGYPRLGNSSLHIAHLLYGGIALTAACLLMLIYSSPTAQRIGSVLTGVGLGLFFDEVGKFITSNNDYFYKPAAPIIYIICLVIALVYILIRRRERYLTDAEVLADAFEDASELLEEQQTSQQHRRINEELNQAGNTLKDPDFVELVRAIQKFADSETVRPGQSVWQIFVGRNEKWLLGKFISYQRVFTAIFLIILVVNNLSSLVTFSISFLMPLVAPLMAKQLEALYISAGLRAFSPFLLSIDNVDLALNLATGLITLYGIVLFLTRHRQTGLFWIQFALMINLCVVNVFTFYVEQFSAALLTLGDLAVLLYMRAYQHHLRAAALHAARIQSATSLNPGALAGTDQAISTGLHQTNS